MGQKKAVEVKATATSVIDQPVEKKIKAKTEAKTAKKTVRKSHRSLAYLKVKKLIDQNKIYPLSEAISLLIKTSRAKFPESAEAHLVIKQDNLSLKVNFPFDQGKKRVVAIADDKETMDKIEMGNIDFYVLLASPKVMPKLVSYARILGPKGLMPNPKEGTITDKPYEKAKILVNSGTTIKTERKTPLIHVVFGRVNQKETELAENLNTLIKAVGQQNIRRLVISSTMGPGINVSVNE
jgi:large subunit ribosomal protein L1